MTTKNIKYVYKQIRFKKEAEEVSDENVEVAISGILADASNLSDNLVDSAISGVDPLIDLRYSDEVIERAISKDIER